MNKIPFVYSKKWWGLDYRFWLIWIGLLLITVLSWAVKRAIKPTCPLVTIEKQGTYTNAQLISHTFKLKENVKFSISGHNAPNAEWYVDSILIGKGIKIEHAFLAPGKHSVKAVVNNVCSYYAVVHILAFEHMPSVLKSTEPLAHQDIIEGATTFDIGAVNYFTTQVQANAYEWQILELPEYGIKTEQTAGYSIISPGTYTLQLMLDNDPKKIYTKSITVNDVALDMHTGGNMDVPKPVDMQMGNKPLQNEEAEDKSTAPSQAKAMIPDNELLAIFKLIRDGKKGINDLQDAMCNGAQTKVLANDEKVMTLAELCDLLQSKKWALGRKPKVNGLSTTREGTCVKVLYIKYK